MEEYASVLNKESAKEKYLRLLDEQPPLHENLTGRFTIGESELRFEVLPTRLKRDGNTAIMEALTEALGSYGLKQHIQLIELGESFDACYVDLLRKVRFFDV